MQQHLTLPSDQSASRSDVPLSKLQMLKGRGQLEVEVLHDEPQRQGWDRSSRCQLDGPIEWLSRCSVSTWYRRATAGPHCSRARRLGGPVGAAQPPPCEPSHFIEVVP